jgi:hypothetical protein
MSEVLIALLAAACVAVAIILFLASRRPEQFHAARSMKIAATPSRLYDLISNLRQMNTWNPYALRETKGTVSYSGPDSGPGAMFHFNGRGGSGSVSVLDCSPSAIVMRLQMTKPIAGDNRVEFNLKPEGDTTEVTWAMSGRQSLPMRIMSLFIDCDRMLARDFDEGLSNLKAIAEAR